MSRMPSRGSIIWVLSLLVSAVLATLLKQVFQIFTYRKNLTLKSDIAYYLNETLASQGFNLLTAKFITCQAAHETGNFQSKVYKENHNLFGMKYVKQRFAIGEKNGHAEYLTIEDSISDYVAYFLRKGYLTVYLTPESFVQALKLRGYFEADEQEYVKGVKYFYNLYFSGV